MIYSFLNDMLINIVQSLVIDFFDFHQDIILGCIFWYWYHILHRKYRVLILKHGITNEKTAFKKYKNVVKVHVALFVFQSCCALAQVF